MITNKVFKAAQMRLQIKQNPSQQYKAVCFCCVSVLKKEIKWLRNLNYYTTTIKKQFFKKSKQFLR